MDRVTKTVVILLILNVVVLAIILRINLVPERTRYEILIDVDDNKLVNAWWLPEATMADINCMAMNIYHEARGEPIEGQYAVAEVVIRRVKHYNFEDDVCGVVTSGEYLPWDINRLHPVRDQCHFSWVCDGKSDATKEFQAVLVAQYIARDVLTNPKYVPELEYSLYYHGDHIDPYWNDNMVKVAHIGSHVFWYE